jgi:hypothetical protein
MILVGRFIKDSKGLKLDDGTATISVVFSGSFEKDSSLPNSSEFGLWLIPEWSVLVEEKSPKKICFHLLIDHIPVLLLPSIHQTVSSDDPILDLKFFMEVNLQSKV